MGATLVPLIVWNVFAGLVVAALLQVAESERSEERWPFYLAIGMLFLLGPASLVVYLFRYFKVSVALGERGLILSGREEIAWEKVRRVEHRGWRPKPWKPFENMDLGGWGCVFVFLCFQVVVAFLFAVFILWILWVVFLPVLVLYSPWHSRVFIELSNGSKLIYRDVVDAEEFAELVSMRID